MWKLYLREFPVQKCENKSVVWKKKNEEVTVMQGQRIIFSQLQRNSRTFYFLSATLLLVFTNSSLIC